VIVVGHVEDARSILSMKAANAISSTYTKNGKSYKIIYTSYKKR